MIGGVSNFTPLLGFAKPSPNVIPNDWLVRFFVSVEMTAYGLAPRIQEACDSIGLTCSN